MQRDLLMFFNRLIRIEIKDRKDASTLPDNTFYTAAMLAIQQEKYIVQRKISEAVGSYKSKTDAIRFIKKSIAGIEELRREVSDVLLDYETPDSTPEAELPTWMYLYDSIYIVLDEMLLFIETEFTDYVDLAEIGLARWKGFKVRTRFSVAQIGHIIRLLCDAGFFEVRNKREMLAFFSMFFTTSRQENISAESLRKKFYESEVAVSKSVREIFTTLMNQSRKSLQIILPLLLSV